MTFFETEEGVAQYIEMTKNYDGRDTINKFIPYLKENDTILEIGIGPGKDFDILSESFNVTGSDNSKVFLDIYAKKNNKADLLKLDAITLNTDRKFNSIYSNKVLHHISKKEIIESINNQARILTKGGIIFHTFWYGEGSEDYDGLIFNYYKEDDLEDLFKDKFEILEIKRYKEEEDGDSIFIVGKKIPLEY